MSDKSDTIHNNSAHVTNRHTIDA